MTMVHGAMRYFTASLLAAALGGVSLAHADEKRISYKFQFAPGKVETGYTQVAPSAMFNKETGFGFEEGAKVNAVDRGGTEPLHSGYCTSDTPFYFTAALAEGNYKVTVTLGDAQGESDTTVKAELRRLMLEHVHTDEGKFETKTFIVNVRTPKISTGGQVRLKAPRETTQEAWAWDNNLTLEFSNKRPCVAAVQIEKVEVPTVFVLGDSTVCDQSGEPFCSWGQMLPRFFKPEIAVANHGESGESVASSNGAKRFQKILTDMKRGDYFLTQFGHNDMKSTNPNAPAIYKADLEKWITQVKEKGGTPVIITPMNRHSFQENVITNSLREYPQMAREAAKEGDAALIDLNAMSKPLYEFFGPTGSIAIFEHNADRSKFDSTHHSPFGAYELAKCVVTGIRQDKLELAKYIVDDFQDFDPAHPDAEDSFHVPPSVRATTQRPLGD